MLHFERTAALGSSFEAGNRNPCSLLMVSAVVALVLRAALRADQLGEAFLFSSKLDWLCGWLIG